MPVDGSSPENYVEVIDTMGNIGPIVDFCVMYMDRQGQGQVRFLDAWVLSRLICRLMIEILLAGYNLFWNGSQRISARD